MRNALKVLLVDDEEELVSSMTERLSFRGIEALSCTTGLDALKVTAENPIDVVVLDVKMPGLSGTKLMKKLKEVRAGMHYIFLTGHGSEEDYRACCEAGAFSYLVKPVEIEELVKKIREAVTS